MKLLTINSSGFGRLLGKTFSFIILFTLVFNIVVSTSTVFGITKEDTEAINGTWVNWAIESSGCFSGTTAPTSDSTSAPSQDQAKIAQIIIGIAKTDNLGPQGALIALMVGLDESSLTIYANSNVPVSLSNPAKQAVGSDHDSVGVFQQRPSTGWSTIADGDAAISNKDAVWQLMDPAYSAEAFFGSPPGANAPSALSKGLQNIGDWRSMEPWKAAQTVQASGDASGENYKKEMPQAQALVTQYYDSSPAVPLPIPLSGGAASGGGTSPASCPASGSSVSGDEHQLAQQILASPNVSFDYGPDGIVANTFKDLAAGREANLAPNAGSTNVSVAILKLILTVAQSHKINVSALTDQHSIGDIHTAGDAVDINIIDGVHITGRDPGSVIVINASAGVLPAGSGFGQVECGPAVTLPPGFIEFTDTCTHLHVQVPRGTP